MNNKRLVTIIVSLVSLALILIAFIAVKASGSTTGAKESVRSISMSENVSNRANLMPQVALPNTGANGSSLLDSKNCYSGEHPAASGCDQVASQILFRTRNCWSDAFHASTDCDRLASGTLTPSTGATSH